MGNTTKLPLKLSLVIPLFNNEKTLHQQLLSCAKILNSLCRHYEILVLDDASSDTSYLLLKKYFSFRKHFKIIHHKINLGIAGTIKELYQTAKYPYIALFSVDGDWNPSDIGKMILSVYKNRADIVIGKRQKEDYLLYRKIVSFFYNLFPRLLFGVQTYDAGSIKIFKKNVYEHISLQSESVFFEAEFIIKASQNGAKVISQPISFQKKIKTSGTGGNLPIVLKSLSDMVRLKFSRI